MRISPLSKILLALLHTAFASTAGAACFPQRPPLFTSISLVLPVARVSEAEQQMIHQRLTAIYSQDIAALGGRLEIKELPMMDFAAWTSRRNDQFLIEISKGARFHAQMTPEAYALILCHELGHHLGGPPLKRNSWASAEGQADYYSTLTCMRRYYQSWSSEELYAYTPTLALVDRCQRIFSRADDIQGCTRALNAARHVAAIDKDLSEFPQPEPSLESQDPTIVDFPVEEHSQSQCRLDTYKAGALEQERPRCWYYPTVGIELGLRTSY